MEAVIKIVLIEDSAVDAELVLVQLKRAGLKLQTQVVDSEPDFLAALSSGTPDVILSDFSLPGFDGMTALTIAQEKCPDTPFVFYSGTIGEERAREVLTRGAADYIPKGKFLQLAPAVERALRRSQLRQARKVSERALRQKEQRLRDIIETSQDWIWELDTDGRYIFSNRAVKDMLGYRPNELNGRTQLDFVHSEDRSTLEQALDRTRREGYGMTGLVARWRAKNGEFRWLEKNILPLFDAAGEFGGYRGTDRDITERKMHEHQLARAEETVRYLASYDALTGLAKRSLFCEHVSRILPKLAGQSLPLVVLVFDLERLSTINTSMGRLAGDKLLQLVAERMRTVLGDTRSMAHLGGGTFAVVFTDLVDPQDAAYILRNEVSRLFADPFVLNGQSIRMSAKSGISHYPRDGADADTLLQRAEAALRRAKESGEKYLHYKLQMNTQVMERMALENRLESALAQNQFELYYQPTVNLSSGRIESCEALIRWHDPEEGLIAPASFIPILESTGMIIEVGQWALKQAAAQALQWRLRDLPPLRIAVNVSPLQLKRREFAASVLAVLARGTAKSVDIDIEITESMLMSDMDASIKKLHRLRAEGVRIALDDFGTGFSSLSLLAKLPIDVLKIDRTFVSEIGNNESARAVASTIVTLAHAFKMRAVAEGVETQEQLELLRGMGCDYIQGYLISLPVPAAEFETMISEDSARVKQLTI